MSTIRVDTVSDSAGTGPVALTSQHAAKCYWEYNQATGPTLNESLNLSSMTDVTTGQHNANYTNSFDAASHAVVCGSASYTGSAGADHIYFYNDNGTAKTAGTSGQLCTANTSGTRHDTRVAGCDLGDLA
jgi:hypothetical protein